MKKLNLFVVLFVLMIGTTYALPCSTYTYGEPYTDGTDFFGVNTTTYNKVPTTGPNVLMGGFTTLTPRLNFTVYLNETMTFNGSPGGNQLDGTWQIDYYNVSNLQVKNGTTILDPSNYTFTTLSSTVDLINRAYENTSLYVFYNRTFIKNVDNLVGGNGVVCTQCSSLYQLNVTPVYGSLVGWQIRDADLKGNNWAGEYTVTNRTCAVYGYGTSACTETEHGVYALVVLAMIIGILFLVFTLATEGFSIKALITIVIIISIVVAVIPLIKTMC